MNMTIKGAVVSSEKYGSYRTDVINNHKVDEKCTSDCVKTNSQK